MSAWRHELRSKLREQAKRDLIEGGVEFRDYCSGLGSMIERAVKPIAVALRSKCLDDQRQLKPDSRCKKIRDYLNKITKR